MVCSSFGGAALADQYDDQINAIKQTMVGQQVAANAAHAQANTAAAQLASYNAQISVIRSQIALTQAQSDKLNAQIAQAQAQMAQAKSVLGANLKSMYLNSSVTPLEMIASSSNLSDYFNQQQYQDTVKDKIQTELTTIQQLADQLQSQEKQVSELLANQRGQAAALATLQQQAAALYAAAQQNAAAADAQVQSSNQQISSLKAQQYAAIAAASRHLSSGGAGCGGYPGSWCNSPQDSLIDSWGMYNRECVSYAAWKASANGHYVPYWGGRGNANQWPSNARAAGISVNNTPEIGNVAIYMGGYYGHAMVVESIKGSNVIVSSFNGDGTGHFAYDEWPISSLQFIHFR